MPNFRDVRYNTEKSLNNPDFVSGLTIRSAPTSLTVIVFDGYHSMLTNLNTQQCRDLRDRITEWLGEDVSLGGRRQLIEEL